MIHSHHFQAPVAMQQLWRKHPRHSWRCKMSLEWVSEFPSEVSSTCMGIITKRCFGWITYFRMLFGSDGSQSFWKARPTQGCQGKHWRWKGKGMALEYKPRNTNQGFSISGHQVQLPHQVTVNPNFPKTHQANIWTKITISNAFPILSTFHHLPKFTTLPLPLSRVPCVTASGSGMRCKSARAWRQAVAWDQCHRTPQQFWEPDAIQTKELWSSLGIILEIQ